LVDTRDLWGKKRLHSLDERDASALATSRPYSGSELETWALREKLAVTADGWFVPLVVADSKILLELMGKPEQAQLPSSRCLHLVGHAPAVG
jgi:hypothetical protein